MTTVFLGGLGSEQLWVFSIATAHARARSYRRPATVSMQLTIYGHLSGDYGMGSISSYSASSCSERRVPLPQLFHLHCPSRPPAQQCLEGG
jgi:hypothetical protein